MNNQTIAFIGGGNMARSLISGLLARGSAPESVRVAEPVPALREALAADFGVRVRETGLEAADGAATWVLAVKPQVMRQVCEGLATLAQIHRPLVVSVAAGVTAGQLDRWLGGGQAVVRAMPNTPALLGAGATGLYANAAVSAGQREAATALMQTAGLTAWIPEEALMDAVTAVSGSGPAYVFLMAEAMQAAGEAEGLAPDTARTLVLQTLLGASRMLSESGEPAAVLRQRVTSPGGTTQAALESFEASGFRDVVARAVRAATARGRELAAD
ncbi:pyrroline-5-carboxylate reductase [Arenimonas alkanexedens]